MIFIYYVVGDSVIGIVVGTDLAQDFVHYSVALISILVKLCSIREAV